MKSIKNELTTLTLNSPSNLPNDIKCESLAVCYQDDSFYSYWKPSFKEWLKIVFGGHIRLIISAPNKVHPMVMLDTET